MLLLFSRVYNITFESPIFFLLSKNQIILCWVYATGYTTGWSYSFIQSSGLDNRGLFLTITQIVQPLNQPTRVFIMYWKEKKCFTCTRWLLMKNQKLPTEMHNYYKKCKWVVHIIINILAHDGGVSRSKIQLGESHPSGLLFAWNNAAPEIHSKKEK